MEEPITIVLTSNLAADLLSLETAGAWGLDFFQSAYQGGVKVVLLPPVTGA